MPPASSAQTRHGFRILVCPDAELLRRQVATQAAALGPGAARKVFWADDEPFPPAFWTELTTQNLFSTPTVIVLRRAESLRAEAWDRIDEALPRAASTALPVFCLEGAWKDGKPPVPNFLPKRKLWPTAESRGWIWQSQGLTDQNIAKFIDQWAAGAGLGLDPAAKRALEDALPRDAFSAGLELDKIALAAGDARTVTAEHAQLIAPHGDMEFFEFMRALSVSPKADPQAFRDVWARVLDDKLRPSGDRILFQLLGYVSWQARQMWLLNEGEDAKVRMSPRDKPALSRTARRLSRSGIARVIELTLDAQLGVISGARRPDDTLEAYVAALANLLAADAPAPTRQDPGRRP
jgi:DNA polymerase-3 subunit delta